MKKGKIKVKKSKPITGANKCAPYRDTLPHVLCYTTWWECSNCGSLCLDPMHKGWKWLEKHSKCEG